MERYECYASTVMAVRKILLSVVIFLSLNKEVCGQDCQFRNDLCDWRNYGDIDWVQMSVMHSATETVHFAKVDLTETTPSGQHEAILTSMTQDHVMTMLGFFYRLEAPNTLTVVAHLDGVAFPMWSRNGTDGSDWIEAYIPVPQSNRFQISMKAVIPDNSTSFVGLTNITLRVGDDECASMPCQNGGVCIDGNSSFTCVCSSGYKGELCQIDTNAPPKTTELPTTTPTRTSKPTTVLTTLLSITSSPPTKPTKPYKTTVNKKPLSVESTVKYVLPTSPDRLPIKSNNSQTGMDEPVMVAVIAVATIVGIAILSTIVWMFVYFKKRSWRPRYHEGGLSMENVSNSGSVNGKWTSTVDLPGSVPESKPALTPVAEDTLPAKVENIYVVSPTVGIVNTGYNIEHMY